MEDQVTSSQQYQTPGMMPEEGNYYVDPQGQRFSNPAEFDQAVQQTQAPPQPPPRPQQPGVQYNVPDFQAMREAALKNAIQQVADKRQNFPQEPVPPMPIGAPGVPPNPTKVVYVRRNLTLAEILVVLAIACGLVTGAQFTWSAASDILSRIEIRDK